MVKQSQGFTLIEVLIVVVIVAILAAVAFPSYQEYVRKTRANDAKTEIAKFMQLQERHFIRHLKYDKDLKPTGTDFYTYHIYKCEKNSTEEPKKADLKKCITISATPKTGTSTYNKAIKLSTNGAKDNWDKPKNS
ncbi:prepilin-type N-terminal cleavage/methylation domain-containing protein [Endozoicomonas sp. SM1973]|uniref:Prepilin-type N-terminal cleavage/methylation domain-containing protein n=1 Tax=Spartinivicinus marinus TaxID=2994442 RepID=A0A853HS36_9GAMM|nr:prepilin-type N-terminal cleavage/methylation domain-containing protein [Spartinivicinus marinus]